MFSPVLELTYTKAHASILAMYVYPYSMDTFLMGYRSSFVPIKKINAY